MFFFLVYTNLTLVCVGWYNAIYNNHMYVYDAKIATIYMCCGGGTTAAPRRTQQNMLQP